jgi:hypothetical protein
VSDEDATLIIGALLDIRVDLRRIRQLLEDEVGEQGDEEEES